MNNRNIFSRGPVIAAAILFFVSCQFNNPVDPEAGDYQGFETVDDVSKFQTVGILGEDYFLPDFVVNQIDGAQSYELQIFANETDTVPYYSMTDGSNVFDIPEAANLYGGTWFWQAR